MKLLQQPLLVFSLVLAFLGFCWNYFTPTPWNSPYVGWIVLYFYLSTDFVHRLLLKANRQTPQVFVRTFMTFTALRLFLNLLVICAYLLADREHAKSFVLAFLLFYFLYLVFEIISLQKDLKKK